MDTCLLLILLFVLYFIHALPLEKKKYHLLALDTVAMCNINNRYESTNLCDKIESGSCCPLVVNIIVASQTLLWAFMCLSESFHYSSFC